MRASGSSVSTAGRAPVTSDSRSQTASFTRSAAKCELRSPSLVPRAATAMLAPSRSTSSQATPQAPAYSSSAVAQPKRATTANTRLARRDHRHARSASTAPPVKLTRPLSLRT